MVKRYSEAADQRRRRVAFFQVRKWRKSGRRVAMLDDTTITRLPLDTKAWHQGYVAGRRGRTGDANPYPAGTAEAQAWQFGFSTGRLKPLRSVKVDC
jgi:hypothetical protein